MDSAANLAVATQPMRVETISLPGFGPKAQEAGMDYGNYRVRYIKLDMDDPGSVAEAEIIETKGLAGTEIVVLSKDKFTFMDKYFLIIMYLELKDTPKATVSVG